MGCYYCNEKLSSYGFIKIDGKEEQVCITCENLKGRYKRGDMGTPNTFKVGEKVYVEYCREWFKGRIYSIDVVKTPKGDMCHYLCYWEHRECFDDEKGMAYDFSWFEKIKARNDDEPSELDLDNRTPPLCDKFGMLVIKEMPKKILQELNKATQMTLCFN